MNRSSATSPKAATDPEFFSPQVSAARRFYLDLNPARSQPLVVVSGGREHCTPDYVIHRDAFPFHSIEYVARGRGTVTLNGRSHELQAGRIFSYGPGVQHDIQADPADPPVKYFVDFAGKRAPRLLAQGSLRPGSVRQILPPNELENIFDELIGVGQRASQQSQVLCGKLLECLLLKIAAASAPFEGVETLAYSTYQDCRQHIQKHFRTLRTLQQIARECHANDAYLCRLFQRYDHQSPYQFLMRLKMNDAADQLHLPGALVKQVAEQAGFGDAFHFSRAFKKVFGLAPDDFRRLR